MNENLVLLLGSDDESLHERIRQIAPDCEIVAPNDKEALLRAHVVYGGVKPDEIENAENLRWLQLQSAGVNRWDLPALAAKNVQLTNASGIHAAPIVEQMFGMLLMNTRSLDKALLEQPKHDWRGFKMDAEMRIISGKTLGVLGVGAIGKHAAQVGRAFGMRVVGLRNSGEPMGDVEQMFTPDERLDFFAQTDVVMNSLPITKDTHGFMSGAEFAALPDGAIVINVGRGETIDTDALMNWLQSGTGRAALLDVTDPEPLPPDHPLWEVPGVFITAHSSGNRPDYEARADDIFVDNLSRFIAGETLHNLVDLSAGY